MKEGAATIRFMAIVSIAFIAVLSTVNELTKAQIERNFKIEQAKKILYAFNIFPEGVERSDLSSTTTTADIPWKEGEVLQTLEQEIEPLSIPVTDKIQEIIQGTFLEGSTEIRIYQRVGENGELMAYGLPLSGKGLWGTIEGFGAVAADLQNMIGIAFTKQVETPGLGARIVEEEYKAYFRNLDLSGFLDDQNQQTPVRMVKDKDTLNIEESTNSVEAITGATQTSQGVLNMVNDNLQVYFDILKEYQQQTA